MAELNIGALTDSSSYTGSLGTTNIYDLYKFNINSPGSFKFAIDNLSGNADIFLLNNSGATLESSTNAGNAAETINADSLVAGEYTLKILQVTGDIKYTLNLAPTETQKTSAADTLTGAKSDSPLDSNNVATLEKTTADKDVITGDAVDGKTVTAETKIATPEEPVSSTSETSIKSELEKNVTEAASAIATSETTEKPVTPSAETAIESEPEKPVTAIETVADKEPKTGETVTDVPDASKPEDKSNTATNNGEDKKTENENTAVPTAENTKELDAQTNQTITASNPFTFGTFIVDSTGKVGIDYLLDGGLYRGQLAIISLKGMEKFVPGSEEFIKEAAARAMSNSEKGHIAIDDLSEGARFSGNLPEGNFNEGAYLGVKTFAMTPGDEFGIAIVPNGTFKFVYDNPGFGGDKRPLFSMVTANPNEAFHLGQIADVTGEGNTFAMEDLRFDLGTDKDYNDFTFQIRGAKGKAPLMDSVVNPDKDWRQTDLGKAVIAYAKPYVTPEPEAKPNLAGEVSNAIDELEKEILNPSPADKETPETPNPAAATDKNTTDGTKFAPTDKVEEKPGTPTVTAEEKVKDTANNSGDSTQVETPDKVDTKPTGAATTSTAGKDTAADEAEKLPVEKTPVSTEATEVEDKVIEAPAAETLPSKSTAETEVAATKPSEKVETKPEVLPGETQTKVESKPKVLPAESKEKEESKTVTVTEVETTETPKVAVVENPVDSKKQSQPTESVESQETAEAKQPSVSVKETDKAETTAVTLPENSVDRTLQETQPTMTVESQESAEVKPSFPVKESDLETMPVTTANQSEELPTKEVVSETPAVSEVISQDSWPNLPAVDGSTSVDSVTVENPQPSIDVFPASSELDYSLPANLIARLESMKQSLTDLGSADDPVGNSSNETLIGRLENVVQKLMNFNESTPVSDRTVTLVDRLQETVDRLIIPPAQPTLPSIETAQFDFPIENQPIIGVIDTGFAGNNPDIDYSRITWGQDRVDGDADPRIEPGQGNEHGTHVLGIIAATQNNAIGIDGINEKAPVWAGRAIGSGKWAESLVEYVDFVKASGKQNGVINLSMDLIQINPDKSERTRYEFTPAERAAIEYARQHNVVLAVAAGNDGDVMSVLGQASQEFDNIITVGAAERINDEIALSKAFDRASYSSYGQGLDILAPGGTVENPELSTVGDGVGTMAGTSVATAKVTGAISQVWAANPSLNYRQVIQIIKDSATDLKTHNWDGETGAGVVNLEAAVALALATIPQEYDLAATLVPETWGGEGKVIPTERASETNESFRLRVWHPDGVNLRKSPKYDDRSPYSIAKNTWLNFDAWTWGDVNIDPVTGGQDALYYRTWYNGQAYWVPSIWIDGYPPSRPPLLPPTQPQPQPQPQPIPQVPINSNSANYRNGSVNPFAYNWQGQCTWYTYGRMLETGLLPNGTKQNGWFLGNAESWRRDAIRAGLPVTSTPTAGARGIVVWPPYTKGTLQWGHVAFLEEVYPDGRIRISESNWAGKGISERTLTPAQYAGLSFVRLENATPNPQFSSPQATPGQQREYRVRSGDTLSGIAQHELGNANRWREIQKPGGGTFTEAEARQLQVGQSVYLPVSYQSGSGVPVNQQPSSTPVANSDIRWVNFSGTVGPSIGVNLRNSTQFSDRTSRNEPYGKLLEFDAWTYGETGTDMWLGTPDARWFKVKGTNLWVPSAYINGNPPNSSPMPGGNNSQPQPKPAPFDPGIGQDLSVTLSIASQFFSWDTGLYLVIGEYSMQGKAHHKSKDNSPIILGTEDRVKIQNLLDGLKFGPKMDDKGQVSFAIGNDSVDTSYRIDGNLFTGTINAEAEDPVRQFTLDDDTVLELSVNHKLDATYYRKLEGSTPVKVAEFVRIVVRSGENWEKAKDVFLDKNQDVVDWIGGIGKGLAYLGAAALIIAATAAAVWFALNNLSGIGFADDAVGYAVVVALVTKALKLANVT